ncbi:MAG TPA: universal stress protein [Thermoanaerobaculia bacterium]|nr:universal stress protein [Thermoanaerobaculia bacterium]
MVAIRTVLCPVDFTPATERQLALAADLCRAFGARLVLHHNVEAAPPGAGVGWMYAKEHARRPSAADAERSMQELLDGLPGDIETEAKITHGLATLSVAVLGERLGADLIVLTSHGETHEDHRSVTEHVIDRATCAVLALHEAGIDTGVPRFADAAAETQVVLVPTDFTEESRPALELAFDLARRLDLDLHLLHVLTPTGMPEPLPDELLRSGAERLRTLVPEELAGRVSPEVVFGDPAEEIVAAADRLGACCIVMGEHTRAPLRRWFTRDTSRATLQRAHCPIWFVPGRAA